MEISETPRDLLPETHRILSSMVPNSLLGNSLLITASEGIHIPIPQGGGGTQIQRGAAPALRISRKKGSFFKPSACPRFCKRRVLFVPRCEVRG